jgi:hypothetical protein
LIKNYLGNSFNISEVLSSKEECLGRSIFLKLDIEGAEYDLLDDIILNSSCLNGICIEFHDIDKLHNLEAMRNFIKNLNFKLIHFSVNDCSITKDGFPNIIELSLMPKCFENWPLGLDSNCYLQNSNKGFGDLILFD